MGDEAVNPKPQNMTPFAWPLPGRKDIKAAWVRTYHETGRLIHVHILRHQKRAGYGAKVFIRLAKDTHVSSRTLQECVQFYRCFPILRVLAELGWNRCLPIGKNSRRANAHSS